MRVFDFLTGKIILTVDESLDTLGEQQSLFKASWPAHWLSVQRW